VVVELRVSAREELDDILAGNSPNKPKQDLLPGKVSLVATSKGLKVYFKSVIPAVNRRKRQGKQYRSEELLNFI